MGVATEHAGEEPADKGDKKDVDVKNYFMEQADFLRQLIRTGDREVQDLAQRRLAQLRQEASIVYGFQIPEQAITTTKVTAPVRPTKPARPTVAAPAAPRPRNACATVVAKRTGPMATNTTGTRSRRRLTIVPKERNIPMVRFW